MNIFDAVKDFHLKYKQHIGARPTEDLIDFRRLLINEEVDELDEEFYVTNDDFSSIFEEKDIEDVDWENVTKELCDILYVTVGFAVTFGLPLEEVFRRTHTSNMTKDGGVREDGKILKGEGYEPPVIRDLFDGS